MAAVPALAIAGRCAGRVARVTAAHAGGAFRAAGKIGDGLAVSIPSSGCPMVLVLAIVVVTQSAQKEEIAKLQGEWTLVSTETRTKSFTQPSHTLTIKDDTWTISTGREEF